MKYPKWFEIACMKWAILFIKKGWGADCEEYDPECGSCKAKKVIEFLETHIKYTRDE